MAQVLSAMMVVAPTGCHSATYAQGQPGPTSRPTQGGSGYTGFHSSGAYSGGSPVRSAQSGPATDVAPRHSFWNGMRSGFASFGRGLG